MVQKLRERDENMAFKCTGDRPLPHLFNKLACCSVLSTLKSLLAEVVILACRWHV